jgi:SAM-dependent methyltransferase
MARITIRFGTGESGNAYLGEGFSTPEPDYVWCLGETSALDLPLGRATTLTFKILSYLDPPEVPGQRLTVLVDGIEAAEMVLSEQWQDVEVTLPPSDSATRRIVLHHPDARTGIGDDPRDLSVALSWAEAELADDDPALTNDLLVPPASLLMDGAVTSDQFRTLGEGFIAVNLIQRAGLTPLERVLEIGSGNGQKARVLARYLTGGSYDGLDIVPGPIQWCRDRYAHLPHFRFHLADIASSHYRPEGALDAKAYRLPFADGSFDLVFLCSVFTHLLPAEVANYTREIARVLRTGGRCVATYFLLHDDVEGWSEDAPVAFPHAHGIARVRDEADPSQGVAHDEAWVRMQWREAGMRVAEIAFGRWSGAPDGLQALQDAMLVVKPG